MRNALALLLIFFAETLVLQLYFNMNKMYPKSHLMLQKYDEERRVWIICWNKLGCLMFLYCTLILTKFEKKNIFDIPSLYPNKWYGHIFSFRSAWMVTACSKHISLEKVDKFQSTLFTLLYIAVECNKHILYE